MQKFFFILLFACIGTSLSVNAQRKIVVYDAETKVPMRKVWVWADTQKCDSTNYLGQTTIPQQFDTLTIIKSKYLPLRIPARMVGDSISMIKDEKMIGEVVVYGKDMQTQLNKTIQGWMKADANERAMLAPSSVGAFDFFSMFDFKAKKYRKQRQRMLNSFKQMDKLDEDPIIQIYKETQKEQQQKKK